VINKENFLGFVFQRLPESGRLEGSLGVPLRVKNRNKDIYNDPKDGVIA